MNIDAISVQTASEMLPLLVGSIAAYILFQTIATHIIFKKLGVLPYHAWIPVWSSVMFVRVSGVNMLLLLLVLVPFGATVLFIMAAHKIGTKIGFGAGLTVLAALLPPVWFFVAAGARKPTPRDLRLGLV